MARGDVVQLFGSVTQGVADGFAVAQVNTGLSTLGKEGLAIKQILIEQVTNIPAGITADMNWEWALSRTNKAAMPTIFDNDIIWKRKLEAIIATNGAYTVDSVFQFNPQIDLTVIETALFFMIDTNLTAVVNNSVIRIDCEVVSVSDAQRIAILQNSLN